MLGTGSDASDDEDMMIASLTDFNEEEEEEEEEDDEDDDDISNHLESVNGIDKKPTLMAQGGGSSSRGSGGSSSHGGDSGLANQISGVDNYYNLLHSITDVNTNSNDSGYGNNNAHPDVIIGESNDTHDDNDAGGDDDDDDMAASSAYSFTPSIATIDEEGEEDVGAEAGAEMDTIDNNNNNDNKLKNKNKKSLSISVSHQPIQLNSTTTSTSSSSSSMHPSARDAWKKAYRLIKCMKDPWEKFHIEDYPSELATRHRFHALTKQWVSDQVEVKMQDKPFDKGAMRSCYRIKKLPSQAGKHKSWKHAHNYVAKQYLNQHVTRDVYFSDVLLQMNAKLWGEEYSRHNPPKKVDIVQMCVLEFPDREAGDRGAAGAGGGGGGGRFYHLEHFIEGDYTKYNSNSGYVEESLRLTPQAFSHFTFERSGHQLIVVDIQGVGDLWTDPQIHSTQDIFGEGNLSCKGMALFFHSHQCNPICRSLGLSPFDLASDEVAEIVNVKASKKALSKATVVKDSGDHISIATSPMHHDHLISFLDNATTNHHQHHHRRPSSSGTSESDDDGYVGDTTPPPAAEYGSSSSGGGGHYHNFNSGGHGGHHPFHHHSNHHLEGGGGGGGGGGGDGRSSQRRRQRFYSESEDSVALNQAEEEYRLQFQLEHKDLQRPACVQHELQRRNLQATRKLCDSVLGQVHHELAKYHEMGRFVDGKEEGDLVAALFHERCAAELGVKEAMVTMASIYFDLPRELLVNVTVQKSPETTLKGEEYLLMAAGAGDRGAMIYLARAYETGQGLSTDCKSAKKAVEWYEGVLEMQCEDEVGEFDPLIHTPPHSILATLASLYACGGADLVADPERAAELYNRAAEEATKALQGRLATKYYSLAEEALAMQE